MSNEKCIVCDDVVNPDELLSVDGVLYHITCFKCNQCDGNLSENDYFTLDGILYCKTHFEQKSNKNRTLPRKLSLPKPSELRKTSSRLSSIFFRTRAKRAVVKRCTIPLPEKREARQIQRISDTNSDDTFASDVLATSDQSLTFAGGQLDPDKTIQQFMQNPAFNTLLAGLSNQNEIDSQVFLKNLFDQLTQNPEMMNAINQLGQQMDGNQDLSSIFAVLSGSQGDSDFDMSFMVQQMMPFFSQYLCREGLGSNLLQQNPITKPDLHRRCYSDSASINGLSIDCQMNIKETAQKIEDEYPALEIFSSVVETAALLHDNVYDIYGLADLCTEEELAEEFMETLKRDVCRRLGKRYDRCRSKS